MELPTNRKAIGSKWILKRKSKCDGSIEKYKTRLVAKGFTQKPSIDYEETYSLVAKFTSIRILMSIVSALDLELYQMDVKTSFLNGDLKEENKVYKLKKSLYGLKQASRQWYYTFHNAIVKFGFRANDYDHCVYH